MFNLATLQILVFIWVFYAFPKPSEGKVFKFLEYIFLVSKTYKSKSVRNLMKTFFLNEFLRFYDLSLDISVKAFLPSLRVLNTSQDREKMIRMVSVIKEIWVVSILLVNLLNFFQVLQSKV